MTLGSLVLLIIVSPLLWFNVVVDPFGIFQNHNEYIYYTNENNKRFGKIKYLLKYPDRFQNFIFGSSRVNYINPDHFREEKFFNMTYSAGAPRDHLRDLRTMADAGVKVKKVIIGVDFLSFFNADMAENLILLRSPYPVTFKEYYDFYKLYLLNIPQKELLCNNIGNYRMNRQEPIGTGIIAMNEQEAMIQNDPDGHLRGRMFLIPASVYQNPQDFSNGLQHFRELIAFLKNHDIDYVVFINPTHSATYLNLNLDAYMDLLRGMAGITSFVDFSGLNSVCINDMNFLESSHYRWNTGDMIIRRITENNDPSIPEDFGYLIHEENVENHIQRHLNWLEDYFNCLDLNQNFWHTVKPDPSRIKSYPGQDAILKTDEKKQSGTEDTILISAPYLKLTVDMPVNSNLIPVVFANMKVITSHYNHQPGGSDAKFIRRGFHNEWELLIPTTLPGPGFHTLSAGFFDSITGIFYKHCDKLKIKVLQGVSYPVAPLTEQLSSQSTADSIISQISAVNGKLNDREHHFIVSRYLNLNGWAVNARTKRPVQNLVVKVNDRLYPIRHIQEYSYLEDKFNFAESSFAGWTVTVPLPADGEKVRIELGRIADSSKSIQPFGSSICVTRLIPLDTTILNGLTKLETPTKYHIDHIQGMRNKSSTIRIRGNRIMMTGWAVDHDAREAASSVYIMIGDKLFSTEYGLTRHDVANFHKVPAYSRCGWRFEIPVDLAGKGSHTLKLIILNHNGTGYYTADGRRKLLIQ